MIRFVVQLALMVPLSTCQECKSAYQWKMSGVARGRLWRRVCTRSTDRGGTSVNLVARYHRQVIEGARVNSFISIHTFPLAAHLLALFPFYPPLSPLLHIHPILKSRFIDINVRVVMWCDRSCGSDSHDGFSILDAIDVKHFGFLSISANRSVLEEPSSRLGTYSVGV